MDDLATTERSRWELWAEVFHGRVSVAQLKPSWTMNMKGFALASPDRGIEFRFHTTPSLHGGIPLQNPCFTTRCDQRSR